MFCSFRQCGNHTSVQLAEFTCLFCLHCKFSDDMHVYDKYCVFYLCIYIIILCLCEFVGWCNLSAAMVAYNILLVYRLASEVVRVSSLLEVGLSSNQHSSKS